jgi:hypothetical protein
MVLQVEDEETAMVLGISHMVLQTEDEESSLIKENVHGKTEVKSLGKLYKISSLYA